MHILARRSYTLRSPRLALDVLQQRYSIERCLLLNSTSRCWMSGLRLPNTQPPTHKKEEVSPVAFYLQSIGVPLHFGQPSLVSARPQPRFTNYDLAEARRTVSVLRSLRFSERAIISIIQRKPEILHGPAANLRERFRLLQKTIGTHLDFSDHEFYRLIEYQPYIIGSKYTPHKITEKLQYLHSLGLNVADLKQITKMDARFTLVDIDKNIKNTVKILMDTGIRIEEIGQIIRYAPGIIGNIRDTPRARVVFFIHDLGFTKSELAEAIIKFPPLLRNRMSTMKCKYDVIKEAGFSQEDVRNSVYIFGYSLANIYNRLLFIKAKEAPPKLKLMSYMVISIDTFLKSLEATFDDFETFVEKNADNLKGFSKSGILKVDY